MALGWFDAIAPQVLAVSTGIRQGNLQAQEEQRKREEEALRNRILQAQLAKLEMPEAPGKWAPTTMEEAVEFERQTNFPDAPDPVVSEVAKAGFPDTPEGRASYLKWTRQKAQAEYPDRFRAPQPRASDIAAERRVEAESNEGDAILSTMASGTTPGPVRQAFSEAYSQIIARNRNLPPGVIAQRALAGVKAGRPDLFRKEESAGGGGFLSEYERVTGGPIYDEETSLPVTAEEELAPAPPPVAPTAPTAATPSGTQKRVITQDQADYLRETGQWDPSLYEVR
jgi:hypothetical protein